MKPLLTALLLTTLVSSCSTYHYLSLDGIQANKNNREELVWENDTVWLSYDFSGRWGTMAIKLKNKTDQPMYINWEKSVIIKDGESIRLQNPAAELKGNIQRYRYSRESELSGTLQLPEGTDFMAPGTSTSRAGIDVTKAMPLLSRLPDTATMVKAKNEFGTGVKYRQQNFSPDNSPFRFQVYLTFGIGNGNKEFSLLHHFYASQVIETENGPEAFSLYKPAADRVYTIVE